MNQSIKLPNRYRGGREGGRRRVCMGGWGVKWGGAGCGGWGWVGVEEIIILYLMSDTEVHIHLQDSPTDHSPLSRPLRRLSAEGTTRVRRAAPLG